MMHYTTAQALGQARLTDLHDQARRDALARAARPARRRQATHRVPGLLAVLIRRARRPEPVPGEAVMAPRERHLHAQAADLGDGR